MNEHKIIKQIERLIEAGEGERALKLIDEEIEFEGHTSQLVNAKAVALMILKRYEEALSVYDQMWIQDSALEFIDRFYNLAEIHHNLGNDLMAKGCHYFYACRMDDAESKQYIHEIDCAAAQKERKVLEDEMPAEQDCLELANLYVIQGCCFNSIFLLAAKQLPNTQISKVVGCKPYLGYADDLTNMYIVAESDTYPANRMLLQSLQELSKKVYYIKNPIECAVNGLAFAEADLVKLSLNNQEVINNLIILTPMLLVDQNTGEALDTTGRLIAHLGREAGSKKCRLFIYKSRYDKLTFDTRIAISLVNQDRYNVSHTSDNLCLYQVAQYTDMYSPIYGFDIKAALDRVPEVKISVVIPVRGAPASLRYTLLTCLDQDYEDYEIVLSDNGDPGDESVRELARELNDRCVSEGRSPKIRYYHTPGLLPLPKSFEYAHLKACGEFQFGLGADDALLPGSLRVLARCIDEHPDVNIIAWKRFVYFWPGMYLGLGGLMMYDPNYTKGSYTEEMNHSVAILAAVLTGVIDLYQLPMCYMNSGMRRSYINQIINRTGTFMGGSSQDVYLGVLNLYLNKEILFMNYPIVIAGQGRGSTGAKVLVGDKDGKERTKAREEYQKYLVKVEHETPSQAKMPITNWDRTVLINQLLRVQDLKLGRVYGDDQIDFRNRFELALSQLSPVDQNFNVYLFRLLEAAKLHGSAFEQWFKPLAEKTAASRNDRKQQFTDKVEHNGKLYEEKVWDRGVRVDMSKHGIYDIYAASQYVYAQLKEKK